MRQNVEGGYAGQKSSSTLHPVERGAKHGGRCHGLEGVQDASRYTEQDEEALCCSISNSHLSRMPCSRHQYFCVCPRGGEDRKERLHQADGEVGDWHCHPVSSPRASGPGRDHTSPREGYTYLEDGSSHQSSVQLLALRQVGKGL